LAGLPSQTAQDARRDVVVAELAALSYADRVSEQLRVEADDQVWITSRIPDHTEEASWKDGCRLGSFEGEYPTEVICTVEYGEVLLLDADGQIDRAFPMPGAPPD
jgi:hypothetical protein